MGVILIQIDVFLFEAPVLFHVLKSNNRMFSIRSYILFDTNRTVNCLQEGLNAEYDPRSIICVQASSAAIAHSIHVGLLLPGLIWMRGEDGSSAVIFQGRVQCPEWGIKDGKAPFGLTLQSAQMRCETDDPSRL